MFGNIYWFFIILFLKIPLISIMSSILGVIDSITYILYFNLYY